MTFLYMCVRDHFSLLMRPYGTIGQWSFLSWLLGRTRPGPKAKRLKRHMRKRKWTVVPKRPGYSLNIFSSINTSLKYSWLCVHRTVCRCVFVSFLCVVLWEALEMGPGEQKWASESIIYIFCLWSMWGWVRSMFTIFRVHVHFDGWYRPIFFWYRFPPIFFVSSTSTVDFDRFFAGIDGRCDIDLIFK